MNPRRTIMPRPFPTHRDRVCKRLDRAAWPHRAPNGRPGTAASPPACPPSCPSRSARPLRFSPLFGVAQRDRALDQRPSRGSVFKKAAGLKRLVPRLIVHLACDSPRAIVRPGAGSAEREYNGPHPSRPFVIVAAGCFITFTPSETANRSGRHHRNRPRSTRFQELSRTVGVKQWVAGLQTQEESVSRGQHKARHVENRVMRPGQTVKAQHPARRQKATRSGSSART